MKILFFCHSLISDWNHGNAHFLRGLASELAGRGHQVRCFEPLEAWSVQNLIAERGELPLAEVNAFYPALNIVRYVPDGLDLSAAVDDADLVIVHEWNEPELVRALGALRIRSARSFQLLFHDTHHRSVTAPGAFNSEDLAGYDGVLAFGEAVRERYLAEGWASRVWTFHEAADTRVFGPAPDIARGRDVVFIGNWGDEERSDELSEFIFEPARRLRLSGSVYGVRYPEQGIAAVRASGLSYSGWLANYRVPQVLARHRVAVHVPRRPYALSLPGIPTIRVFESLACGIPLVSAPWSDSEGLFRDGDLVFVRDGEAAEKELSRLLSEPGAARELGSRGRETILSRHTCAHRAESLLEIARDLGIRMTGPTNACVESTSMEPHRWA